MIPMTLADIAEAVGGRLVDVPDAHAQVTGGVEFDSRKIGPGGLFVALNGANSDGHEFAATAVGQGAVAVLAARPVGVPAIVVDPRPDLVVEGSGASEHDADGSGAAVLQALGALARASVTGLVAGHGLNVVGVTGSSGKTSTKDLIASVLAPLGPVVAPPGSFNNELGHPWTALRADADTRNLVLELSARGIGHIRTLAQIAPPRIGVVLNVGFAHLGEFGSQEAIAQAKGELVEALPAAADGGVAILNADDPLVSAMASRTTARVVLVGQSTKAGVRATGVRLDSQARASFTLEVADGGSAAVTLSVHGEHQIGNALSAAAVALECGADVAQIAAALSASAAVSGRRMDVRTRADAVTVINDSYNANPDSMRAAIRAMVTMARSEPEHGVPMPERGKRKTWAILGEMGELGPDAVVEHDALGRFAVRMDVEKIICVGSNRAMNALYQGAVMEGSWADEAALVPDVAAAVELLEDELEPGDIVLVKASQSVGLWRVADALLTPDNTDQPEAGA
ncbi:UDP-N-acetylmuramoyl-tripeptide--D-alanyl-D-alanine ligase [Tomitella biformata]|uniref:UDP-N-acetylmuramoyl-tripeptide--D-alanyl-D- alanine ligase n=1 Tax=Tomitella biformata TaxID=630403 RepID=UPI001905866B|nr:UDP-N-acetylmuramoyl-tripeptide--D-alanyl-D-alanine ligase [Tomitella biformata]